MIGRLLSRLTHGAEPGQVDIVVVCNGCTDDTANIARAFGGSIRVCEIAEASKHLALVEGDRVCDAFPRLYVDADIEIDLASVRQLIAALSTPGIMVVAPQRDLILTDSAWPVRAYYRVWDRLPAVREGMYGRGVIGVSDEGYRRIASRPEVLGDDIYVHTRFSDTERQIVPTAVVRVSAPRRTTDLVRRRIRTVEGNRQLASLDGGSTSTLASAGSITGALKDPTLWPDLPAFLAITAIARAARWSRGRRGTAQVWLRDESSRQ